MAHRRILELASAEPTVKEISAPVNGLAAPACGKKMSWLRGGNPEEKNFRAQPGIRQNKALVCGNELDTL